MALPAYLTNPSYFAAGTTVNCSTLSKTNGTVKGQPLEDWRAEDDPVLVDWGNGDVSFVKAELLELPS